MKITVIGTGYVGLVTGACFAELGHQVVCVDKNTKKIQGLKEGRVPFYEPGLEDLIRSNTERNRLFFTTSIQEGVEFADIIFIAVGTPSLPNGAVDLSQIESAATEIGQYLNGDKLIVNKSTVPMGTGELVRSLIYSSSHSTNYIDIASVPEFLREGSAVKDTFEPDRIILGVESDEAKRLLEKLYKPLNAPIFFTDISSAELIKYASNSFLALKISFINEIANLCERVGADVKQVAEGMGLDSRIGTKFLNAGVGFGGSCFPKDTKALLDISRKTGLSFNLLEELIKTNDKQYQIVIEKAENILGNFKDKTIAILGLAFKPNTDDIRESPAIKLIHKLFEIENDIEIKVYDPLVKEDRKSEMGNYDIYFANTVYDAASNADALIFVTEWEEFKHIDFEKIQNFVKRKIIIDGRNFLDGKILIELGYEYHGIGIKQKNINNYGDVLPLQEIAVTKDNLSK